MRELTPEERASWSRAPVPMSSLRRLEKKERKKPPPVGPIIAVLAIALVGLVLVFSKRKVSSSKLEAAYAHLVPKGRGQVAVSPRSPKLAAKAQKQDTRDLRAGFKALPFTVDEHGQTAMKVQVKTALVCHPGDFEAMMAVVGSEGHLLLSLEPFGSAASTGKPVTRSVSIKDIKRGATFDLPVQDADAGLYGLFLCTDGAKQATCLGKKGADFNAILGKIANDSAQNAVFYFRFTVIKPKSSLVYGGLTRDLPRAREDLAAQDLGGDHLEADMRTAAALMRGVQSLPPVTKAAGDNTALMIPVAMWNPRCSPTKR